VIGVFDSGIGGLSVHRALVRQMPDAGFIYLADQANAPYGVRGSEEIVALTRAGCMRLFDEGASLVVLACNTAAAVALRPLQREWLPDYRRALGRPVNVIGLIVPTIEAATGLAWKDTETRQGGEGDARETIGIFATPATVRSQVYAEEIHKRRKDIDVFHEACPDLARLIEAGADLDRLALVVGEHARALSARIGNVKWKAILGCTHYEIVADLFARALPQGVTLIHQPDATAGALIRYLEAHPEYYRGPAGMRRFITTGASLQSALALAFWGESLGFETLMTA
jgi:glutamate racemase